MGFSIRFLHDGEQKIERHFARGILTLGTSKEHFHATLGYWSKQDYEQSWYEAIKRIVEGDGKGVLLVNSLDPATANFIDLWPMWRLGDEVAFRERLIMMDELDTVFLPETPHLFIGDYVPHIEGEPRASEWRIPLSEVAEYYHSLKP